MTTPSPIMADLENEQDVIGVMLKDEDACASMAYLKPEHFWEPVHQRVMAAMSDIRARGQTVSLGAVKAALRGDAGLAELDKAAPRGDYLSTLWGRFCAVSYAQQVAMVIYDDWTRRQAVEIASNAVAYATGDNPRPAIEVLSYLRNSVDELSNAAASSDADFLKASDVASGVVQQLAENLRAGKSTGYSCGLRCVDYRMGGFQPGSLIVVGGRPGMMKTGLARVMAHNCAVRNPKVSVLFLGLEMGPNEMMERELSSITYEMGQAVEYRDMSRGSLHPHDMAATQAALQKVPANLILKDCHSLGLDDVRRLVWSLKRKGPLALVVVDYLQLMRKADVKGRTDSALYGEITAGLKLLARQAGCAIVLLSQLSRKVEEREDKRPVLSDLRESGSIEQDADFVLFPYRESYYLERAKPPRGKERDHEMRVADMLRVMEVICAKARRAAVGSDMQTCYPEYDHVSDVVRP